MLDLSFIKYMTFSTVRVTFVAEETVFLPAYKGSAFRGSLGEALEQQCCVYANHPCKNNCSDACPSRFDCAFSQLFNSYVPLNHLHQRKFSKSPHPYIVNPRPNGKTVYQRGETFGFDFTLIGSAIDLFPLVRFSFVQMGKMGIGKSHGKFTILKLESLTQENKFSTISFDKAPNILFCPIDLFSYDYTKVSLCFENPLRLKKDGALFKSPPSFEFLIERLAQRLLLLSHFHCGAPWIESQHLLGEDINVSILESNLKWVDWQRYSGTQDSKMNFDGHIGTITYSGNIKPWLPLLVLGSYIHVGLTTTFGLGKYRILNNG